MSETLRDAADRVKRSVNILDYARERGWDIKRTGKGWSCCCPLHNERTPSFTLNPDKGVFHCFGCGEGGSVIDLHAKLNSMTAAESIADLAGIELTPIPRAGSPSAPEKAPPKVRTADTNGSGPPKAVYDYHDRSGRIVQRVKRFEHDDKKDFRQYRVLPDGTEVPSLGKNFVYFPYHLPEILAASPETPIFIAEGEKDVDTLRSLGYLATCCSGGSKSWRFEFKSYFRDRLVFIVPDNDEPGAQYCQAVAESLQDDAQSVRVVRIPDSFEGRPTKDITDFYSAFDGPDEDFLEVFEALCASARLACGLPPMQDAYSFVSSPLHPEPPQLVEGIIHYGSKLVFGGGSKSFKTWTLLDFGMSVASGQDWLGFPTTQARVLYVNFELPTWAMKSRIKAVAEAKNIRISSVTVWNLRGEAAEASKILPLISQATKRHKYGLIILDPLYKLLGSKDENSATDAGQIMNEIERLGIETGAAVAFGAHFAKGDASAKFSLDRISGSGVFIRDPDSIVTMTAHDKPDHFTVDLTLRNFPPQEPFVVRREHPLMVVAPTENPEELRRPANSRRGENTHTASDVLDCLKGSMTSAEWQHECQEAGISRAVYFRRKTELKKSGKVFESPIDGKWCRK